MGNKRVIGLVKFLPENPIGVEVGVREGNYSRALLSNHQDMHLYCVDVWGKFQDGKKTRYLDSGENKKFGDAKAGMLQLRDVAEKLSKFGGRVNILQLPSTEAAKVFDKDSLDFVYIDADHTYQGVKEDIQSWWPLVKEGGILCGHDYGYNKDHTNFGVKEAVDEFVTKEGLKLTRWAGSNWRVFKGWKGLDIYNMRRLDFIKSMLESKQPFTFSRFGEGECKVIAGYPQKRDSFTFQPNLNPDFISLRDKLEESLLYEGPNFYVGVSPSIERIFGKEKAYLLEAKRRHGIDKLMSACLLHNVNYIKFIDEIVPLFKNYTTTILSNSKSDVSRLPFPVESTFKCNMKDAWFNLDKHIMELSEDVKHGGNGRLFLLMAGPMTCILCRVLHKINPNNTYLDIGSSLDPYLFSKKTRGYQKKFHRKLKDVGALR
jgi:hypothetical protein